MQEYISKQQQVLRPAEQIYAVISRFDNLTPALADKVEEWQATEDSCSFKAKGFTVKLRMEEREPGKYVKVVGDGDKVTAQYPASGSKIPSTATVILYCGAEPDKSQVKIPDLTGKTYEQAVRIIEEAGLYMEAGGSIGSDTDEELTVMRQSPAAGDGATVQFGSVITVEFYKKSNTGE